MADGRNDRTSEIRTVSVIGAGAVGSAYAALLHATDPSCLSLIAGGQRGDKLRAGGIAVNGRVHRPPVFSPEAIPRPVDLLFVCVKHHQLSGAIADMRRAVGDGTEILSLMNGMDSEERIGAAYGREKILYALNLGIDALRVGHRVTYRNQGRIYFGEFLNPRMTDRLRRISDLFDRAGIVYNVPLDMRRTLWRKFMINVGINQVSAALGAAYRVFQAPGEARELAMQAMREVMQIAAAEGVALTEEDIASWQSVLATLDPDGKTSMLQDVEAQRKTEVEMFAGKVMAVGRRHGIPTPVNDRLFSVIRAMEGAYAGNSGAIGR